MRAWMFVALGAYLAGCGGKVVPNAVAGKSAAAAGAPASVVFPVVPPADIRGDLAKGQTVRIAADSWAELVAKAKPDFTWRSPAGGDHNLLWIEGDAQQRLVFHVDRAWIWQPREGKLRWALLDRPGDRVGYYLEQRLTESDKIPESDFPLPYAVAISTSATGDKVFQVAWDDDGPAGSGVYEKQRILFLWQHPDGRFQFIGEGGEIGGGRGDRVSLEASVVWGLTPVEPAAWSPEIHIAIETTESEYAQSEETDDGLAYITERREMALYPAADGSPAEPGEFRRSRYTSADKGQTIDDVAEGLAKNADGERNPEWTFAEKNHPLTAEQGKKKAELKAAAKRILLRMNPDVGERPLKDGEKLQLSMDEQW